jgi:ligand-binding sensor domain-containing protein/signal transduction histidine kinase
MSRLAIIFVLCSLVAAAQPKRFEAYTIHDGLSQSTVRCILQDETGFIWMGTQDGLNRFDGKNFKILRKNNKGQASLSHNNINQLVIASDRKMWIATGGGIDIYDAGTDSIASLVHHEEEKSLIDNNVTALLYTSANEIWAGTENGITIIDPKSYEATAIIKDFNVLTVSITSLAEDRQHNIWAATRHDGVYIFNPSNKKPVRHISKKMLGLSEQNVDPVRNLFLDKSGTMWISTNKGLFTNHHEGGAFQFEKMMLEADGRDFTDEVITCVMEDRDGDFWVGTHNGVLIREKESKEYRHYSQNINNPYGLSDRAILSFYQDSNGIMWIGTYNGVNKYVHDNPRFQSYKSDIQDRHKSLTVLRSLYTDDDQHIFVGTVNSLIMFDRNTETIEYIKNQNGRNLQDVFCITKDSEGQLWVGNASGLQKISRTPKGVAVTNALDQPELKNLQDVDVTQCIALDTDNYLIATFTESGLFFWNKKKRTLKNFLNDPSDKNSIPDNKVNQIFISREGTVWLATNRGIVEFDPSSQSFNNFHPTEYVITGIAEGSDDQVLWLASHGGLIELDLRSRNNKVYTEDDGLPNNTLYSCLPVGDSILWMSSNKGISEFNIRTRKFTNYDISDGLQSNEYNQYAWYASSGGKLYFGGMEGFDVVTPGEFHAENQPPLVVTNIRVIEKNKFADVYPIQNEPLRLRYFQNAIGFDYTLLDFSSPERNEFLCRLEGFDESWIDNGKNTSISYTNLSPGTYSFQVKTKENPAGNAFASYTFTILAPFWQTRIFFLMVGMIGLLLLGLVIRSYYKRKLEKQRIMFEKQQAVAFERTRIATDMHDDLGAGLSRIKFLSESIGIKSLHQETITEDVDKIKQYSHDMIDKMGEIVWALNRKNDSLSDLISYTRSYAAEYLEQNNIACTITTPEEVPPLIVSGEFRRNLFLVVKEALHNIVKHAKAQHVDIEIVIGQKLYVTLNDNGKGFDIQNAKRLGNGISNMNHRMNDVKGGFEIRNEQGTSVRLWAPLPL